MFPIGEGEILKHLHNLAPTSPVPFPTLQRYQTPGGNPNHPHNGALHIFVLFQRLDDPSISTWKTPPYSLKPNPDVPSFLKSSLTFCPSPPPPSRGSPHVHPSLFWSTQTIAL